MKFTGERFLPELHDPEISYEHWHRYLFASLFVENKRVLDIACGEGYGSYFLSRKAKQVVGVDISAETINYASGRYIRDNLSFSIGGVSRIPVKEDHCFDIIVSFETIEHVNDEDQGAFILEVKRLLSPNGIFIVSTPNKLLYSDIPHYKNEFHLREFNYSEFKEFLSKSFRNLIMMGQKIEVGSYINYIKEKQNNFEEFRINYSETGFFPVNEERIPLYYLAVCSDELITYVPSSFSIDLSQRMISIRDERIIGLDQSVQALTTQVTEKEQTTQALSMQLAEKEQYAQALAAQVAEKDQLAQALSAQLEEKERSTQALSAQVAEKEQTLQVLSAQVADKERTLQALSVQAAEKDHAMQVLSAQVADEEQKSMEVKGSNAWKIALLLRRIRGMIAPQNSIRDQVARRFFSLIGLPLSTIRQKRNTENDLELIRSSGLFDASWYRANNPDVANAKIDPILHYLLFGGFERRDPSSRFCSGWYLDTYEDVKKAGVNPLVHFLKYGISEGRKPQSIQVTQPILPQVVEKEKDTQVLSQHPTPTSTPHPSNGTRIENLFLGFKKCIYLAVGIFNYSKRAKFIYILKNFGLVSLVKAITGKLKATFLGGEDINPQSTTYPIPSPVGTLDSININQWTDNSNKTKLLVFLKSDAVVELPTFAQPVVSIILLFYNRAEISLQCLETLAVGAGNIPFEVVIVDNASTDETPSLLNRIRNAKIIRNSNNSGFGGGCNQAVDLAVGKYLLFLNNDIELMSNSIKVMVDTLENGTNIGAVGGKLIFPDGTLQEAGSIIWRDGSCAGYGRNDDPFKPEFSYLKEVDFCSGALLLTPRDLFLSLGKFDLRYAPAYYEDADYCLQVWRKGFRVVFQPFAVAVHHEFGSSGKPNAIALQIKNREKFKNKWKEVLSGFYISEPGNILFSREHKSDSKRILFIDDQIPDYRLGSGYPRSYRTLQMLSEMGYRLTFLPMQIPVMVPEITQSLQLKGIEVMYGPAGQKIDFEAFLKSRQDYYDIAFVSRPHNMQDAIKHLNRHAKRTMVVYDAEAIFSLRDILFFELNGKHMTETEKERLVQTEVGLINEANIVTTISEMEKEIFLKYGASSVHVLGHIVEPKPTPATFEERMDILFIGGILGCPSPNEDAVRYFVNQIFPLVRKKVKCEFYVVGTNRVKSIWDLESTYIHIIGRVEDLTPYYNRCRLFVVPTRYSAGISLKLLEASAYGLPAVVTPLTAKQLGWQENRDILVGHDPMDFARKVIELYSNRDIFYSLRQNALDRIRDEYSPEHFKKNLEQILTLAMDKGNGKNNA